MIKVRTNARYGSSFSKISKILRNARGSDAQARTRLQLPSGKHSTNPERVPACNRRRSNSCKPSQRRLMSSATWSIRRHRRLWRMPAEPHCRRSNHVCDGNSPAPSSRSRRGFRWRPAGDPSARTDGIMTSATTCRIWSDIGITIRLEQTASIVCCSTRRSTQRFRTHGAKMSARGGYEKKRWTLCDG